MSADALVLLTYRAQDCHHMCPGSADQIVLFPFFLTDSLRRRLRLRACKKPHFKNSKLSVCSAFRDVFQAAEHIVVLYGRPWNEKHHPPSAPLPVACVEKFDAKFQDAVVLMDSTQFQAWG